MISGSSPRSSGSSPGSTGSSPVVALVVQDLSFLLLIVGCSLPDGIVIIIRDGGCRGIEKVLRAKQCLLISTAPALVPTIVREVPSLVGNTKVVRIKVKFIAKHI